MNKRQFLKICLSSLFIPFLKKDNNQILKEHLPQWEIPKGLPLARRDFHELGKRCDLHISKEAWEDIKAWTL